MLRDIILKNKQNITTLIVILVVLEDYLINKGNGMPLNGLTVPEIDLKYNEVAERFNRREKFYKTYLQRHSGSHGFLAEDDGRYLIKEALVNGASINDLQVLRQSISEILVGQTALYQDLFSQLEEKLIENDPGKSRDFILSLFNEKRFRNYGQVFEVLSYSILKVYFGSFGFVLRRVSVSFSNDGGMDFLSYNGFYQVTAAPSTQKIKSDFSKLPDLERVMVFSSCSPKIRSLCLDNDKVTQIITSDDLKSHFLDWLYRRDMLYPMHMKVILSTIRDEMKRETA
jgi:hypothetical protein